MSAPLPPDLESWIGNERVDEDLLTAERARSLAATLDRSAEALVDGAPLPPGWHWIYFGSAAPRSQLGADGHEKLGAFLPPLPHARRMWAGGAIRFPGRLRLGERAERRSTIQSITPKEGRSGPLVFVTVRHRISNEEGTAVDEEQELVYRAGPSEVADRPPAAAVDIPEAAWSEPFVADEVTLFRFSALTFNGHRIHYDHPYATGVEGYPGLIVHGPLLALLLLDAGVRRLPGGAGVDAPRSFSYRALRPAFCNEPFRLEGLPGGAGLRAVDSEDGVLMQAWLDSPAWPDPT